jgi:hypothetical protein
MFKTTALSAALAVGLATAASATILPVEAARGDNAIVKVGEGCGANRWRGPGGACHDFNTPYGSNRGTRFECPPGFHIGEDGGRCWPNR